MKKGQMTLGIIVGIFIAVIIGVILADQIGDSVQATENTATVTNETLTISSGTATVSTIELGVYDVSYFGNGTNHTGKLGVAVNTHVNFTEAGVITVSQVIFGNGNHNITYSYYPNEYVQNDTAQTLISLIVIFFVLAVAFIAITPLIKQKFF